jgi:hypothetical protein
MSDLAASTGAATRAADALLRMAGGRVVKLRVPAPGVPGDAGEQLGLVTPGFQDVDFGPVVFRKARAKVEVGKAARYELMVSASAVGSLVGSLGYGSVGVLFGVIAGVVVDDALLFVESCTASEVSGEVYCYRLGLRGAVAAIV